MIKKQYSKSKPVCKVTFTLTTDQVGKKADVRVLGNFNDWNWEKGLVMKAKKKDYTATIELAAGNTYEFRYLVDNENWHNDEAADDYHSTPFFSHNSILVLDEVKIAKAPAKKAPAKKAAPKAKATTKKAAPVKKTATKKATTAKAASARKVVPAKKAVAKKTTTAKATPKAENLTKIEGIGPKIAGLLNADGIVGFAALAKAKQPKLKAILEAAGSRYKMHNPSTWPEQAKLAAAGKWEELKKLQDELKGGKR